MDHASMFILGCGEEQRLACPCGCETFSSLDQFNVCSQSVNMPPPEKKKQPKPHMYRISSWS